MTGLIAILLLLACQTAPPSVSAAAKAIPIEDEATDLAVPDLTGKWSASLRSIYRGEIGNLDGGASGADIGSLRVTVFIEIQDGRVFYGHFQTGGSEAPKEEVFGAIRSDGSVASYITEGGRGLMFVNSPDEIEICGGRGGSDVMLAFCSPLHRVE
jgi:hypothetical protein